MGNYRDIEIDFVERTLALISQYEAGLRKYKFEEQFNYTLLINCLLGLIVLPKEKTLSYLPNGTLLNETIKKEMGVHYTSFNQDFKELKPLLIALRHCVAHFKIRIESMDDQFHIDHIIFENKQAEKEYEVARFQANELLPFIRYYATWLLANLRKYKRQPI